MVFLSLVYTHAWEGCGGWGSEEVRRNLECKGAWISTGTPLFSREILAQSQD